MNTEQLWLFFGSGFAAALLYAPLLIRFAKKVGVVDHPGHRKLHREPVPYLGGVVIFAALATSLGLYLTFHWNSSPGSFPLPFKTLSLFGASLVLVFLGLLDDFFGLKAREKFAGQLCVALVFSTACFRFEVLHIPGFSPYNLPSYIGVPLTVFWILSIINALNMVDGVDGLASSVATTSLLLIAAAAALLGNGLETGIALATAGALFAFLFFNWKPARIYLGDSGSGGLGMFLAGTLLALGKSTPFFMRGQHSETPSQPFFYQIIILTMFLAYPALEITLSVARRLFRGKPLYRADQGHIHHRLLKKRWPVQAVVWTAVALTLLPGITAIATLMKEHGVAAWFFGLTCLVFGLGIPLLGFLDFLQPHAIVRSRPHFRIANHFSEMQKLKLQMAHEMGDVVSLLQQACHEFGVQGYTILVKPHRDGKGGAHFSWEKELTDHHDHMRDLKTEDSYTEISIFKDRVTLEDGKGRAFWIFEPHTKEEELDVEYRVLVSEFMKEVLRKIEEIKPESGLSNVVSLPHSPRKSVGSSSLRRQSHRKS